MNLKMLRSLLNYFIALIWLINGLFCKVLNLVPRHQEIVSGILGEEHSRAFTLVIGIAEILMAAWVLSGIQSRINALTQITIVLTMNILEFWLVPDLLLWGRFNIVFALLFAGLVYYNEFVLRAKSVKPK